MDNEKLADIIHQGGADELRITPALAGKRYSSSIFSKSAWDHPRTCGEKRAEAIRRGIYKGSPPHLRGKD